MILSSRDDRCIIKGRFQNINWSAPFFVYSCLMLDSKKLIQLVIQPERYKT